MYHVNAHGADEHMINVHHYCYYYYYYQLFGQVCLCLLTEFDCLEVMLCG